MNKIRALFSFILILLLITLPNAKALWEQKTVYLGNDLPLSIPTDLPNGLGDTKFFVMKKTTPTTARPEKFGLSGAHGEWDFILADLYNNFYGTQKTGDEYLEKHFAMLAALGVSWIRMDVSWERVENPQGQFNFATFDKVFDMAKKYNLTILGTVMFTPSWLYSQCPGKLAGAPWYTSPRDLNATGSALYNNFVAEMVNRYKPGGTRYPNSDYGISYWQIWNEEDIAFWTDCQTGEQGNLTTYAYLLKSAYQKIKSVDPNAKVVMGGLTHLDPSNKLTTLYSFLPNKDFDILDIHYYETDQGAALTDKINAFANVRDGKGDSVKEIWVTETSNGDVNYQSTYLQNVFNQLEALEGRNVKKAFWWGSRGYFFDAGNPNPGERTYAIMDTNFYPKEVYFAFGEWLGTTQKKGEVSASVTGGTVNAIIPANLLDEAGDYVVFYASVSKMVTALPLTVKVLPNTVPNCSNLSGPSQITLGLSGTYTATFSSSQGNLQGEIVASQNGSSSLVWFPGSRVISGTEGTLSYVWTPTKIGTYDLFCRAWNDAIAECRGNPNYVDGPPRYPCIGPNSSMTVEVVPTSTTTTSTTTTSPTTVPQTTTVTDNSPRWLSVMRDPLAVIFGLPVRLVSEWVDDWGIQKVIVEENSTGVWVNHTVYE
ncbi:hypothetical protein A3K63_02355 [Candidatus Micrarchaeota archaeon RBG_16_49_10]|nr:MAG: hypothetical protein A3K63_02355 [Candidatus Micrarchaeota archaeon RBG_16_49_10]